MFFLCLQKRKRKLTTFIIERVHKLMKNGLDFNDIKFPKGVSDNCRKLVENLHQSDTNFLLPELLNFDSIDIKSPTRISLNC